MLYLRLVLKRFNNNLKNPYFGVNDKSTIYCTSKIKNSGSKILLGLGIISTSNIFLAINEKLSPLFGNVYIFLFLSSFSGITMLGLMLYSRRIVYKMDLFRCYSKIEIEFFSIFNKNTQLFDLKDFSEKSDSLMGFSKFNITDKGFYWINEHENDFFEDEINQFHTESIISGKRLPIHGLKRKAKKYENKY